MNALELADAIQYCGDGGYNIDASNMLRQQHAEIEALKRCLFQMQNACIDLTRKNPVAWVSPKELADFSETSITNEKRFDNDIPLYTEPQAKDNCPSCEYHKQSERVWRDFAYKNKPLRELSDEEIQDLWGKMDWSGQPELEFARAILRKAQEK